MGIAWLPEDRSERFGKDNSRSAALPEQPPTKVPSSRRSVAELKAQDLIICKAEERRLTRRLFSLLLATLIVFWAQMTRLGAGD